MSSESDLKAATTSLAPHEIEKWEASGDAHTSVRRLLLMRGQDSYSWHADQVLTITKYLSADRGGVLEALEITRFVPGARSTGEDPPPIGEVLRPVAHSLTSIWLDIPDVGSGTLLGILYNLPKLREFTVYAPAIQKSHYEGENTQGGLFTTGKLGLFHLNVGGDNFIKQLLQHEPLGYHTIGLSHNKLIDSYNALINASGNTLRTLGIHDIGKYTQIPAINAQLQAVFRGTSFQTSPRSHVRRQLLRTFRAHFRRGGNIRSQDNKNDCRRAIHRLLHSFREAPDLVPIRSRLRLRDR